MSRVGPYAATMEQAAAYDHAIKRGLALSIELIAEARRLYDMKANLPSKNEEGESIVNGTNIRLYKMSEAFMASFQMLEAETLDYRDFFVLLKYKHAYSGSRFRTRESFDKEFEYSHLHEEIERLERKLGFIE